MSKKRIPKPAKMTVADLIKDKGVPMNVRLWLERFTEQGDGALTKALVERNRDTLEQARLIHDVIDSEGYETAERKFPEEARDYVEEYVFRLCRASEFNIWNLADAAVAALPVLLECSEGSIEGDANFIALDSAICRLTTRGERYAFLTGPRYEASEDARYEENAFKLSRVLADPRTASSVRNALEDELIELSSVTRTYITHPALVRRAFLLMCDAAGREKDKARVRKRILALLDSIEEGGES